MRLDYQKELTPVLYGDSAIKILKHPFVSRGRYAFTMHWHDRMEILYIHSGSLIVSAGGNSTEVVAGELAIFSPTVPHSGIAGNDGVSYDAVMFDISKFHNLTGASGRFLAPISEQKIFFEPVTKEPEIVQSVKEILRLHETGDAVSDIIAVGEIYRLIGLLFKHCLSSEQTLSPDSGRFKAILDFVNQSFCDNISSSTLSRRFGYDETYFCRRFKAVTGLSPMIYIRILRLEKAKKLIKGGNITLSDVAVSCGFSDPGYFSRCFKKHFGVTPGEYALKYKK